MCNTKPDIFGSLISRSNNSYIQCSAKEVYWCMLLHLCAQMTVDILAHNGTNSDMYYTGSIVCFCKTFKGVRTSLTT